MQVAAKPETVLFRRQTIDVGLGSNPILVGLSAYGRLVEKWAPQPLAQRTPTEMSPNAEAVPRR